MFPFFVAVSTKCPSGSSMTDPPDSRYTELGHGLSYIFPNVYTLQAESGPHCESVYSGQLIKINSQDEFNRYRIMRGI